MYLIALAALGSLLASVQAEGPTLLQPWGIDDVTFSDKGEQAIKDYKAIVPEANKIYEELATKCEPYKRKQNCDRIIDSIQRIQNRYSRNSGTKADLYLALDNVADMNALIVGKLDGAVAEGVQLENLGHTKEVLNNVWSTVDTLVKETALKNK